MAPSRFLRSYMAGLTGCDCAYNAVAFISSSRQPSACKHARSCKPLPVNSSCGCGQAFWSSFMQDVDALARVHPYVVPPSARQGGEWVLCGLLGAPPTPTPGPPTRRFFLQHAQGSHYACFLPRVWQTHYCKSVCCC